MRLELLALTFALVSTPSWAIFKCTVDGKTSFQEQPCENVKAQTKVHEQYRPESLGTAPSPDSTQYKQKTHQELLAAYEAERLRNDATFALNNKRAEVANQRAQCAADVKALSDNRYGWNNNLAGAMRSQSEATAASARATSCDTQGRQLEAELEDLRRQCAARGCKPA